MMMGGQGLKSQRHDSLLALGLKPFEGIVQDNDPTPAVGPGQVVQS